MLVSREYRGYDCLISSPDYSQYTSLDTSHGDFIDRSSCSSLLTKNIRIQE